MIVTYKKLLKAPIMELKTQTKLGIVDDFVFNKTNFNLSAVLLKPSGFSLKQKYLVVSASDIVELNNQTVIAKDEECLVDIESTIRIKEAVKEGYFGLNQKVVTKSGKKIGVAEDFYINSDTLSIVKIYVKTLLSERLISVDNVLEIKGKKIIIKDDYATGQAVSTFAQSLV